MQTHAVTRINERSADAAQPYSNLFPIVEFLVRLGNVTLDGGFLLTQAGWICRLQRPIDFEAVRSEFEIPASIDLSETHDGILDRLSWCYIEGPGAWAS